MTSTDFGALVFREVPYREIERWKDYVKRDPVSIREFKRPFKWFGLFNSDRMVAFVCLMWVSPTVARVHGHYVFPEYRNKGIGSHIIKCATGYAAAHGVTSLVVRTYLSSFYFRLGWKRNGTKEYNTSGSYQKSDQIGYDFVYEVNPMQTTELTTSNTTPEETQARVINRRALNKGKKAIEKKYNTLERLTISYIPTDRLVPNDWNPNRQSDHDFELLCKSMEEDGFDQPILALNETFEGRHIIIDGEHRWRAAVTLGIPECPTVLVDMTPEQARISTIRHNRARGSHDIELEAEILRDLQKLGAIEWAQDSLMLDDLELNRLLNDISAPESLADPEYSQAWIPATFTEEEGELLTHAVKAEAAEYVGASGAQQMSAMSLGAIELTRKREKLLERARNEEERRMAAEDTKVYTVSLVFSGDEAKLVRKVLGKKPAQKLLDLCARDVNDE